MNDLFIPDCLFPTDNELEINRETKRITNMG